MEKSMKTIITVVAAILILIIGIFIGLGLSKNPSVLKSGSSQVPAKSQLSNPLISAVFASGKVASVSGSTINIASGSQSLAIVTNPSTKMVTYVQTKDAKGVVSVSPKNILVSDLKIGDYITANLKPSASGQFVASSINKVSVEAPK